VTVTHLQYPGTISAEGVAGVDDVPVAGKAAEQVSHALDQRVVLRVDEHLRHQILAGILDESFAWKKEKGTNKVVILVFWFHF